jgi:DNA-binding NtrC family response regulator
MRAVRAAAARAALVSDPVLFTGPRGAGKEALARAMHAHGRRAARPFLVVNCAVVPAGLLDGGLFGFHAGSFPSAQDPPEALVKRCEGGTLFLDEVGRLAPPAQRKVLDLIRTRRYRPTGGKETFEADVRVVAASREPLDALVRAGRFDPALEAALRAYALRLPGLAERIEDVVPLAGHFLGLLEAETGRAAPTLTREAESYLKTRIWSAGVRELRNTIEFAVIHNTNGRLRAADFQHRPDPRSDAPTASENAPWLLPSEGIDLEALNRTMTEQALERTRYKVSPAARLLGLSRATLRYRIRKYGLERAPASDPEPQR